MVESDHELHKHGNFSDPSPYPEIKVSRPSLQYADLLMDDYAGIVSEFTAVSQYLYHHFLFEDFYPEPAKLLRNISLVEMRHMEIIAKLIIKLGGNPLIRGSFSTRGNFWNGCFVSYGTDLCERLRLDIDSEYSAIEAYRKHIFLIDDPLIQAVLKRIIMDEKVHIRLFNETLYKHCGLTYRPLES